MTKTRFKTNMRSNDCVWKIIPRCLWMVSFRPMFFKRRLNHKISSCDGRAATRFLGVLSSTWLILLSVDKLVMSVNILQNKLLEITWVEFSAHVKNFQLLTHCFSLTCARNHSHPQIHIIHAIHIITNHWTQPIINQKTHNSPIINQNTQIINKQSPWKSSIINHYQPSFWNRGTFCFFCFFRRHLGLSHKFFLQLLRSDGSFLCCGCSWWSIAT